MNKLAQSSSMILPALILITAPLEKLSWKIGFTLRPVMILSFVAFSLWLVKSLFTSFSLRKDSRRLLLIFYLMTMTFLLSSINSLEPIKSIRHTFLYGTLFLLFFIMVHYVSSLERLRTFVRLWMIVGIGMCIYGLLQFVGPFYRFDIDKVFFGLLYSQPEPFSIQKVINPIIRSYSLFGDANNYAGYLTTVLPFFICSLLYYNKSTSLRYKAILWILGTFVLVSLILTLSRSGGLGLLAIFLTILILKRNSLFTIKSFKIWLVACIVFLILIWRWGNTIIPLVEHRLTETASARIHLFVAESALKLFLMNPLTGVGLGNFGPAYGRFFNPGYEYYNAHSTFLTILSEIGIIGFIVYMSFYGIVLLQILRFRRYVHGYTKEVLADGLLAGFFGLMAANVFYQNYGYQFFWVFLAMGFSAGTLVNQGAGSKSFKNV